MESAASFLPLSGLPCFYYTGVYFNSRKMLYKITFILSPDLSVEDMSSGRDETLPVCLCIASPPALGLAQLAGINVNLGHTLFMCGTWQIVRPKPVLPLGTSVLC